MGAVEVDRHETAFWKGPAQVRVVQAVVGNDLALDHGDGKVADSLGLADGRVEADKIRNGSLGPGPRFRLVGIDFGPENVQDAALGIGRQQVLHPQLTRQDGCVNGGKFNREQSLGDNNRVQLEWLLLYECLSDEPGDEIFGRGVILELGIACSFLQHGVETFLNDGLSLDVGRAPMQVVGDAEESSKDGMEDLGEQLKQEAVADNVVCEVDHAVDELLVATNLGSDEQSIGDMGNNFQPQIPQLDRFPILGVVPQRGVNRVLYLVVNIGDNGG